MIFWPLSALIWFKNMKKMLLQMTSGFLQLESTLVAILGHNHFESPNTYTCRELAVVGHITHIFIRWHCIARSNEILGWEGVGNRQLLCFFKA
jgi:hypothetical protein